MNLLYPNLYIPGAGKSGTSTLHELLNQHPLISMSKIKEPHFWTNPEFDSYQEKDWSQYRNLFDPKDNMTYYGESSTGYMCFPNFISRLKKKDIPQLKFIFVIRNPIDRLISHYWWLKGTGSETKSLQEAFLSDMNIAPSHETKLTEGSHKNYYQFGLYGKWLQQFYDHFDASQIHIVVFERLIQNPLETINECFDFLDLRHLDHVELIQMNRTTLLSAPQTFNKARKFAYKKYNLPSGLRKFIPYKLNRFIRDLPMKLIYKFSKKEFTYPKASADERAFIKAHYQDDVAQLKSLVNYDFPEWIDFKIKA